MNILFRLNKFLCKSVEYIQIMCNLHLFFITTGGHSGQKLGDRMNMKTLVEFYPKTTIDQSSSEEYNMVLG